MNQQRLSGAISLLGLLAMSSPAFAQTVDVQQYWTSASESKPLFTCQPTRRSPAALAA